MRALKALQAAELRMGGSRAAEPEARTAETVGERTAEKGSVLVTGRTSGRPSVRPRWKAEPMARGERMEPGPELSLMSTRRALLPLSRRGGVRTTLRPSEIEEDRLRLILYRPTRKGLPGGWGRNEGKRSTPVRGGRLALLTKLLPRGTPSTIS